MSVQSGVVMRLGLLRLVARKHAIDLGLRLDPLLHRPQARLFHRAVRIVKQCRRKAIVDRILVAAVSDPRSVY